ncbi:hypothetical protein ACH5RR_013242 [Cinchona calisaya]|uniref:Ribosomal protein S18 n=1 Tax=Cinchona calisaya TaxID=153742 RepID=A0ABD2ZZG6_9GENT
MIKNQLTHGPLPSINRNWILNEKIILSEILSPFLSTFPRQLLQPHTRFLTKNFHSGRQQTSKVVFDQILRTKLLPVIWNPRKSSLLKSSGTHPTVLNASNPTLEGTSTGLKDPFAYELPKDFNKYRVIRYSTASQKSLEERARCNQI